MGLTTGVKVVARRSLLSHHWREAQFGAMSCWKEEDKRELQAGGIKKDLGHFVLDRLGASLSTKGCLETFVVTRRGGWYRHLVSRESRGAAKQPTDVDPCQRTIQSREPCLRSPYLEKGPQHVSKGEWLEESCGREDVQCGSPTPSTTALLEQITQMFSGVRSALHQCTPKKAGLFRAQSTGK